MQTYREMDICNKAKMPHFLTYFVHIWKEKMKKKKTVRFQWVNIPDTLFVKVTIMWFMMPWVVQIRTRETWCLSLQLRNSEDRNLCSHRCADLKYHIFWLDQTPAHYFTPICLSMEQLLKMLLILLVTTPNVYMI